MCRKFLKRIWVWRCARTCCWWCWCFSFKSAPDVISHQHLAVVMSEAHKCYMKVKCAEVSMSCRSAECSVWVCLCWCHIQPHFKMSVLWLNVSCSCSFLSVSLFFVLLWKSVCPTLWSKAVSLFLSKALQRGAFLHSQNAVAALTLHQRPHPPACSSCSPPTALFLFFFLDARSHVILSVNTIR